MSVAAAAAASGETCHEKGSRCLLAGLHDYPSFNGEKVIVLDYLLFDQLYQVKPVSEMSPLPPVLRVKPCNLLSQLRSSTVVKKRQQQQDDDDDDTWDTESIFDFDDPFEESDEDTPQQAAPPSSSQHDPPEDLFPPKSEDARDYPETDDDNDWSFYYGDGEEYDPAAPAPAEEEQDGFAPFGEESSKFKSNQRQHDEDWLPPPTSPFRDPFNAPESISCDQSTCSAVSGLTTMTMSLSGSMHSRSSRSSRKQKAIGVLGSSSCHGGGKKKPLTMLPKRVSTDDLASLASSRHQRQRLQEEGESIGEVSTLRRRASMDSISALDKHMSAPSPPRPKEQPKSPESSLRKTSSSANLRSSSSSAGTASSRPPVPLNTRAVLRAPHPLSGELVTLIDYNPQSSSYKVNLLGREARKRARDANGNDGKELLVPVSQLGVAPSTAFWARLTIGGKSRRVPVACRLHQPKQRTAALAIKIDGFPGLDKVVPVAKSILKDADCDWNNPRDVFTTIKKSPSRYVTVHENLSANEIVVDPEEQASLQQAMNEFELLKRRTKGYSTEDGKEYAVYKLLFASPPAASKSSRSDNKSPLRKSSGSRSKQQQSVRPSPAATKSGVNNCDAVSSKRRTVV